MDISGSVADIHMRTDANNLVSTAGSTALPEQKETIHMIQMLRQEACSGSMRDLAHVRTALCLADPLTKSSASPEALIKAVETGFLPQVDSQPMFRDGLKHKAFLSQVVQDKRATFDYWQLSSHGLICFCVNPVCHGFPDFNLCPMPSKFLSGSVLAVGHVSGQACDFSTSLHQREFPKDWTGKILCQFSSCVPHSADYWQRKSETLLTRAFEAKNTALFSSGRFASE